MTKKNIDYIVPLLLLGYAILYYFQVYSLPNPEINLLLIRPVFYMLVVATVIYILLQIFGESNQKNEEDSAQTEPIKWNRTIAFSILTVAYVFILDYVGFVILTLVYMVALMLVLGVRTYKSLVLVPLVLTTLIYLVCEVWLNVRLPQGFLNI